MQPKPPKVTKETRPPVRRRTWVRVVKWCALLGLLGIVLMVGTVAIVFWMYGRDPNLPSSDQLRETLILAEKNQKQVTAILDSNDRRIGELYAERRTWVPYDKITQKSTIVIDAFVAAEDNKFWTHGGVDYWGMFRAFVANVRAGHTTQGASTITQQVIKNFILTSERTFKRKIQEIILARRLEKTFTKQEIIELYVNFIFFGRGRYGVQEASRFYFGKDVWDLDAGEAAVLASMPKEPETIGKELELARVHKVAKKPIVKDRQLYVLRKLEEAGKITAADRERFAAAPISLIAEPYPHIGSAPEWVRLVRDELFDDKSNVRKDVLPDRADATIDTLGAKVRTTLDPALQADAQTALQAGLRAVDKRHKIGRPQRSVKPEKIADEIEHLAKKLPVIDGSGRQLVEAVVTGVHDDTKLVDVDAGHWPAELALGTEADARYNPPDADGTTKTPSQRYKVGDILLVAASQLKDETDRQGHRVKLAPGPQGAVVIMEVKTRKVRALVGGYDSEVEGFDRATQSQRQPGSAFKPIVYTTAFLQAAQRKCHANDPDDATICATPATVVNDTPEVFEKYGNWKPKNFETGVFEGHLRLRTAMAKSVNTVSVGLAADDNEKVLGLIPGVAKAMGISSKLPTTMAIALGSAEVTPLELTNAYVTLASGGIAMRPRFVDAVDGKALPQLPGEQVVPPEVAYVVTNMLESVTTEGTAAEANAKLHIPIAGKTGTSNEARNTWFIGMTPDYAIGVWVGYDDNRPQPGEQGARVALPVFIDIAKEMKLPAKQFVKPPHVVEATIDKASGLLAPEGAPKGTTLVEAFVEGTEPTATATKAGEVDEQHAVQSEYGD